MYVAKLLIWCVSQNKARNSVLRAWGNVDVSCTQCCRGVTVPMTLQMKYETNILFLDCTSAVRWSPLTSVSDRPGLPEGREKLLTSSTPGSRVYADITSRGNTKQLTGRVLKDCNMCWLFSSRPYTVVACLPSCNVVCQTAGWAPCVYWGWDCARLKDRINGIVKAACSIPTGCILM